MATKQGNAPKSNAPTRTTRRRRRAQRVQNRPNPNPTTQVVAGVNKGAGVFRQTGLDRLAHFEDLSNHNPGDFLYNAAIDCTSTTRLNRFGQLFQRYRFNSLRFEVRVQNATNTSGGYMAGFVADPMDLVTMESLVAQNNTKSSNIYTSVSVTAPVGQQLWVAGLNGSEKRLLSPGTFALMVESKVIGGFGGLSIYMHWDVTFSVPTLQKSLPTQKKFTVPRPWHFWDFGTDVETGYQVALCDTSPDRSQDDYVLAKPTGLAFDTIWRTRPYNFTVEEEYTSPESSTSTTVINSQWIVVVDGSPATVGNNGELRPGVMAADGIISDANVSRGPYKQYRRPKTEGVIFFPGDEWVQVDRFNNIVDIAQGPASSDPAFNVSMPYPTINTSAKNWRDASGVVPENLIFTTLGPFSPKDHQRPRFSGLTVYAVESDSPTRSANYLVYAFDGIAKRVIFAQEVPGDQMAKWRSVLEPTLQVVNPLVLAPDQKHPERSKREVPSYPQVSLEFLREQPSAKADGSSCD